MKNIVVFAIGVVCTLFCHAQTENPRGIYKMTTLTGNLGEINAPFDQYKICTDSVTLHLHVHGDRFLIKDNDHQIFNYTGPNPKTPENKSILIYDSNEKQFMLKWWSNYETAYYPKNDWCLEKYESGVYSDMGRIIVDALTNTKAKDKEQPLLGTWRNLGYLDELKNTQKSIAQLIEQYPTSKYAHQYLVYNEKNLVVITQNSGMVQRVEYDGKDAFKTGTIPQRVKWLSKDRIAVEIISDYRRDWNILERVTDDTPLRDIADFYVQ